MISKNKAKLTPIFDIFIILILSIIVYIFAAKYDILEKIIEFSWKHEKWEIDEFITVSFFLVFAFIIFSMRRWKEAKKANACLLQKNKELQEAISEIRQLKGIIPICASCKQIRDDKGFWHQVESYISERSKVEFSHGICPECKKKSYPKLSKQDD